MTGVTTLRPSTSPPRGWIRTGLIGFTVLLMAAGAALAAEHSEQTISLDGKPVYTQSWMVANPKGLVVYTHGFTDNSRNHRRLYDRLNALGYSVAAWDMPGHGTSYGMRGYIDGFEEFGRALDLVRRNAVAKAPPGTPVYMAGYSMGGLVTLRYAEQHDAEIAGSFYFSPFLKARVSWMRRVLNRFGGLLDRLLPKVETPHGVTEPMLLRDPVVLAERKNDPYFFERITVHLFRQLLAGIEATKANVARLTKPVLFLVAGDELIVEPAETKAFFGRLSRGTPKRYHPFEEMRHELDNDLGREAVFASLTEWLREREKGSAFERLHRSR